VTGLVALDLNPPDRMLVLCNDNPGTNYYFSFWTKTVDIFWRREVAPSQWARELQDPYQTVRVSLESERRKPFLYPVSNLRAVIPYVAIDAHTHTFSSLREVAVAIRSHNFTLPNFLN